ncbi:MAG: hypothetical protein A2V98_07835 [Planctomycetes bacterium RBG_16_64_12]|nr:MAG: hypothetical protein A2V98_07835 [Planctomycetes bacterium RBG_16_64_12]
MPHGHPWQWWINRDQRPRATLDAALRPSAAVVIGELYLKLREVAHLYQEKCADRGYDFEVLNYALFGCGFRPEGAAKSAPRCDLVPVSVQVTHPEESPPTEQDLRELVLDTWHENLTQWWTRRHDIIPDV